MKYETVIGLEIHAQLATASKMFCGCSTKFGAEPNTNICPVCTGQPGTLPVTNKKAVELAIKTALALNCTIEPSSVFARKNYFYPDLPKDYQISQFELPLATKGWLEIEVDGQKRKIGITRVHLEEDAGKLVHQGADRIHGSTGSLADYNRTGTPLMEIVSEPDIRTPKEAAIYMQTLAALLQYLGVSDAKLEEGSLRCDANISIRVFGSEKLGTKTEVKNMNSFKAVEKALAAEEKRHNETLAEGGKMVQETVFFDENTETTHPMRSKEGSHDYRYFPEPDLVPIEPENSWIEEIRKSLPEPLEAKKARYAKFLSTDEVALMFSHPEMINFIEETIKLYNSPKTIVNLTSRVGKAGATIIADTAKLLDEKKVLWSRALELVEAAHKSGRSAQETAETLGLIQSSDEGELLKIVREVITNNPKQIEQYKSGKTAVIGFLVGQVMKASKGRANPESAGRLLQQELSL